MFKATLWSVLLALGFWFTAPIPAMAATTFPSSTGQTPLQSASLLDLEYQPTVEVTEIRSGVLPGVVIGGRYEGLLRILQERYTATGQLPDQFDQGVRSLIEDELMQAGYNVVSSPSNSIFANQFTDATEPGRFLIGGTITQSKLNSYSSLWGDRTEDERTVRWEVFDREIGKVIYRQATQGVAQAEGIDNLAATYEAIRASFRTVLQEPTLIAALAQPSTSEPPVLTSNYEIQAIATANEALSLEQLVGRSIPSIVQIQTPGARGSGFLIGSSGLVVTNQHVIGSTFAVKVKLYDGSTHVGRVLKRDASYDVALLQLDEAVEQPMGLPICHTNAVKVGEAVVAIGNPLALSNTVTQGVVSGFRYDSSRNLIQTDAAINPGNSGGPLLNRQGAVIGIVTEKMVSRGVEGLGFALPIGEALHRLHVQVQTPVGSLLNSCGSPTATGVVLTASGVNSQ
ncbi:trypsin-like peptidase domain-containing protein [Oscillatoria sp. FACHB-1407]|uniref:S1C family serine protease n=1 Tax=Oscillatoria sp. FACHB-1407 TaxID=2692847 RepID=UPI00168A0CA5|nr:trypsin-like peptidase domain-containing protein [Oscillatoria sp. FACHB-1407]MBD2459450.1 trypsin-like peptidase domain-containing protein [Oscillatoria sp. FACHB-1407]